MGFYLSLLITAQCVTKLFRKLGLVPSDWSFTFPEQSLTRRLKSCTGSLWHGAGHFFAVSGSCVEA